MASGDSGARLIDGKRIAQEVRAEVREHALALAARGIRPGLAVVLVGEDPASQVYVRNKDRAAKEVGFEARTHALSAGTRQEELLALVRALNADPTVHGILVQLPLPKGLDSGAIVRAIDPRKDVDGLHPENVAALVVGAPGLVPCTPAGCIELLDRTGIALEGRRVVVLGRSMLVGKPVALLALARHATVTIGHSRTRDLPDLVRQAEILIAAVGQPELVRGEWIAPGATVIDVGINRIGDGAGGSRLVGDVAFEEARARAGAITPVPGGVGPMTIAMLLRNTALAADLLAASAAGSAAGTAQATTLGTALGPRGRPT
jgi:methylenetetrahydrofolate dehydrogenase (NADP+) / methenyltetrahydrofolate cyclohydrolase